MNDTVWIAFFGSLFTAIASIVTVWIRTRKVTGGVDLDTLHQNYVDLRKQVYDGFEHDNTMRERLWRTTDAIRASIDRHSTQITDLHREFVTHITNEKATFTAIESHMHHMNGELDKIEEELHGEADSE